MSDPTPITSRLRFEILRRDNYTCRYCGRTPADGVKLTVDHVVPQSLGGGSEPSNLTSACSECNSGKASTAPDSAIVEAVDEQAIAWAAAIRQAAEIRRQETAYSIDDDHRFIDAWVPFWNLYVTRGLRGRDWQTSLLRFRDLGLTLEDQAHIMSQVKPKVEILDEPFRYFAKLCWSEIRERQRIAQELMGD